ncbi:RCC1/BLIP-II [Durotheca rogersii]|uniref:RCC1/BLIP-II n=1 Tax=Durotheca rogersii TaxID=419775 RepID=UPI00221EC444|nr:RCC1/BLIP-II [Durotheca rogersii]KAI5863461.1 RCC1/BLIP-II [Durotheca rogersii]
MELLAAGFNAWRQLQFDGGEDASAEPTDLTSFQPILTDRSIERPRPLLSCTFARTASAVRQAGFVEDTPRCIINELLSSVAAISGNGLVAEYDGRDAVRQYPSAPGARLQDQQTFPAIGRIIQLAAYETGFAALSQDGRVWTWGDERYGACLGRPITPSSPAEKPGPVEELEDLPTGRIIRIGAAGYLLLALTEGHDLYAWGGYPGRRGLIDDLSSSPAPVVVEECDITDCGVGESHIIVLSSEGDVYVTGNNTNGQLGLPASEASLLSSSPSSWTKVPLVLGEGQVVVGVEAGHRTSFILTKHQSRE